MEILRMDSVNIGIIGLGNMGQNHLRVLSSMRGVEIVFVYDLDLKHADAVAKKFDLKSIHDPLEHIGSIDGLIITSPTSCHFEDLKKYIGKVKFIFVEKPLAENYDECEAIRLLSHEHKTTIQVGFIERFNPAILGIRSIQETGLEILSIDFQRTNKLSSRITDTDVISDLMVHDIDLALYLNGPIEEVSVLGLQDKNLIDFASVMLRHKNGSLSRLQASRLTHKKIRKIQLTCRDSFIETDLVKREIVVSKQSEIQHSDDGPYKISSVEELIEVKHEESLFSELAKFRNLCMNHDSGEFPDALAGCEAMKVCDEIKRLILDA